MYRQHQAFICAAGRYMAAFISRCVGLHPNIAHDADDLPPRWSFWISTARARFELLANYVLSGKEFLRERLIDDHHLRRVLVVTIGEVAAFQQRDLHGTEVARRHRRKVGRGLLRFRHRMLWIHEADGDHVIGHGQDQDAARRLHTRESANSLKVVAIELSALLFVLRIRKLEEECQQVVGIEAFLSVQQVHKAGDEQARPDREHQSQRDLPDDERGSQPITMRGFGASALFQAGNQVGFRCGDGRHDPEDEPGDEGQQDSKGKHPQIDPCIGGAGNTISDERQHRRRGDKGQTAPGKSTNRAQDKAFHQQLTDDALAARTQRRAHGNLTLPLAHARQQQVGDVGTGDQQHHRHGSQDDHERHARVADECCQLGHHSCRVVTRVGVGILFCEVAGNVLEFLVHLGDGDARLHPSDGVEEVGAAHGDHRFGVAGVIVHRQRGPNAISR